MTKHGFYDASTNPAILADWWTEHPDANIGVPTGFLFDAADFDSAETRAWFVRGCTEGGIDPDSFPRVLTGGRGRHVLVAPILRGNVDTHMKDFHWRGDGGYIVAPPSIHDETGRACKWMVKPNGAYLSAPDFLLQQLEPERFAPATPASPSSDRPPANYIKAAVEDELAMLRATPEGNRNIALNDAAFAFGQMVGAGWISRIAAELDLDGAAIAIGLDRNEIPRTIRSGIEAGIKRPRQYTARPEHGLAMPYTPPPPEESAPAASPVTVGHRTLDDLPSGAPPPQLVPPLLTPDGVTILYGPGGTGKGFTSLWFAHQLVQAGRRVTIIDFDNHPGEWGRRAHSMGFTQADRLMVSYRAPFGEDWTAPRGSLAQVAAILRQDLDHEGRCADCLIIDSYTPATSSGDTMGGAPAAQEFFAGIATLGRPVTVLAHVAGGQDKWPAKPFGSIFIHNLARETWAVEQIGEPSDDALAPITLELRNQKTNGRPKSPPQFLTFNFKRTTRSR